METDLDGISEDKINNIELLRKFYNEFEPLVQTAFSNMEKKAPELTGEKCPECGSDLVIRKGKFGEFTACSNYPTCKYIKKEEKKVVSLFDCPICNNGKIIEKKTRRNKIFYGCSNFPKCKTATWDEPINKLCPECKNLLVNKNNIIKCSSCDYQE